MRQCRFCDRWFRNKQAVRRHLGYCPTYQAVLPEQHTKREKVFHCVRCFEMFGADVALVVTMDEAHALASAHGGCLTCGFNAWQSAGWRRVTAPT